MNSSSSPIVPVVSLIMPSTDKPKAPRYRSLDHWRGIACLFVVIFHATLPACEIRRAKLANNAAAVAEGQPVKSPVPNPIQRIASLLLTVTNQLHFGVEMFFVISGYCIATSGESLVRAGRSIREYVSRRFTRIFPPFWCCVALSVVACFVIDRILPGVLENEPWSVTVPWDFSVSRWMGDLTLTGFWSCNITGEPTEMFPVQAWTLCYEEQFYAVMGLLLFISGRHFFRATAILTTLITGVVIAAAVCHVPLKGFFFDHHWFMFASGVGIYWDLNRATPNQSRFFRRFLATAILGLVCLTFGNRLFATPVLEAAFCAEIGHVCGALVFAELLLALHRYDDAICAVPWLTWLQSCGVMCYSIYLVHLFPGKLVSCAFLKAGFSNDLSTLLLCVPVHLTFSVLLGYLFHMWIERRFLRSAPRPTELTAAAHQRKLAQAA